MLNPKPIRLAILTTHPIQYQVPWFQGLAGEPDLDLEVLFCHRDSPEDQAKAGFGVSFQWDRPLLEGYRYRFLKNCALNPSLHQFGGLDTPEIAGLVSAKKYDVVLIHGWHYKSALQAIWACWRLGVPVLARGDSQLGTHRSPLKKIIKYPVYHYGISHFDACLAVGERSRDYFLHYGAAEKKIFRVPHVIDESWFRVRSNELRPERGRIRGEWKLEEGKKTLLFAGKFIAKKRPMDFVRAVEVSVREGLALNGLMVGDGILRAECERYVEGHKLPVIFAGFLNQSEIVRAYAASDILVLPSNAEETWGLVVNEAMSCGLPALVSEEAGCAPDLITSGETGKVFPMGDLSALVGAIKEFSRSSGSAGVQRAIHDKLSHYSIDAAVQETKKAVQFAVEQRRRKTE